MTGDRRKETAVSLNEAAQSLTVHGLPRLLQGDVKYMKFIWFIIFFGALSALAFLINDRVKDYRKREVYLKVESKVLQPLPFPAITVCNSDRFSIYGVPQLPNGNLTCNAIENSTGYMKLDTEQKTELRIACKMFLSGYKDTVRFGGKEIPDFPNSFTYTGQFSPCFTFNKNGLSNQVVNGAGNGLDMILFNDPNDALPFSTANVSRFDDKRRGLILHIHDPEASANADPDSGIAILPGYSHEIVMSRKTTLRKPHPFPSNCHTRKTTLYKVQKGRYTTMNCFIACFEKKLFDQCGVVPGGNRSASQAECEDKLIKEKPIGDCVCPQPCYEITYPSKMAINIWPRKQELTRMTTEFAPLLNLSQASTTGYIQNRFSKIKIYYEELINTDAMEEELYGFTSLISEVGGLMGLLLGCSVISLVELVWLCGLSLRSIFKCIGNRQSHVRMAGDNGHVMELGSTNKANTNLQ